MKRHHEEYNGDVAAFDEVANADATPSKRHRSSPLLPSPPPAAAAASGGAGPITVWQPSPFVKPSANGDDEADPMEAEEGICPLLGRRRSASLPPLATKAELLSLPSSFARGAATPLAPPPLPMPPPSPPFPPLNDNNNDSSSMAIVLYHSPVEVTRLLREESTLAPPPPSLSAPATASEVEKERRRRKRAEGFERIDEEEGEGEGEGGEAIMN